MAAASTPNPVKKINLAGITHVYYRHTDIAKASNFVEDFGFFEAARDGDRIYYRGYGDDPWVLCLEKADAVEFGGAGFTVETEDDLVHATKTLPKECRATEIYELKSPGGGKCVTFYDPVDGWPMHLVYGQEKVERLDSMLQNVKYNKPGEQNRPTNTFQRFEKRPAPVHRLGHYGMCVTSFKKAFEFYPVYFNFFPSELVYNEEGVDEITFLRLDRGEEKVDHHCFFFYEGPKMHVHHSSYETHDFDTQALGHDWLRDKGYENCWGIGRHIMGSQIFDYWFDPSGFIMEHYVDGDLVNMEEPMHRTKARPNNLHIWGPDVPATFLV